MKLFGGGKAKEEDPGEGFGLLLFNDVTSALKAEKTLAQAGFDARVVAPPAHLRAGCDLSVALPAFEHPGAVSELRSKGVAFKEWVDTLEGSMALTDLITYEDFGTWLMVRAGNMKITVDKDTQRIVNTSGGGCPDIPYLNLRMLDSTLADAPRPQELGKTLCGIMLDRAYVRCCEMMGVSV
ncbi:DUF3343 domain-containing protein [bacterium]|nr:DUF3343 domain-containing protein [bacterium]